MQTLAWSHGFWHSRCMLYGPTLTMTSKRHHPAPPDPVPVPQAVLDKTPSCPNEYSCLSSKTRKVGKVIDSFGTSLFVKCEARQCPYRLSFGVSHKLCTCPVRNELYKRHGI